MKIKLSESQVNRLQHTLSEVDSNNKYRKEVSVDILSRRDEILKGKEIYDITTDKIVISYAIDINYKSWGINGISVYGFSGPSKINVSVNYYINEAGDTQSAIMPMVIDWSKVEANVTNGGGVIGIGDDITINVAMGQNGELVATRAIIDVLAF